MFMSTFSRLAIALSLLVQIASVASVPLPAADLVDRSKKTSGVVPAGPRFVIYSDKWVSGETGPPAVSELAGYNVFALSFWLSSGPADQAVTWTQLTDDQRAKYKSDYAAAGISLIVSAFGATETPTSSNADPTATAKALAAFVKQYNLDGVDVDYEDFAAMNSGAAVAWLETFTKALRADLPSGQYILTHAPVAPWFASSYPNGGYSGVHTAVGDQIDWYNVQFYNQGSTEYTDCNGLLNSSGGQYPGTSLFEIAKSGIDQDKLLIGKPATGADASTGFMDPATLATCAGQAKDAGWNGGIMVWEYPDAAASWISTVRSVAWPL